MEEKIYRKKISKIEFPINSFLLKTFINDDDRIEILNFIEKQQENNLHVLRDNLHNIERTDWFYHKNKDFRPYYDIILREIIISMDYFSKQYGSSGHQNDDYDDMKFSIWMRNCWYAKSKKNSFVSPHAHGHGYFSFSFSCYLNIPSKISSLTFMSCDKNYKESIAVKEGDILIFPSHLLHWTNDVEENRSILSGNFIWEGKHGCDCSECSEIRNLDKEIFN